MTSFSPAPASSPPSPPGDVGPALRELTLVLRAVVVRVLGRYPADADVEDVVQETLRRVIESGEHTRREPSTVRPWAIGIARHVAIDHIRGHQRHIRRIATSHGASETGATDSHLAHDDVANIVDTAPGPFEQVAGRSEIDLAAQVLADLPDEMRQALVLFHVDGLAYKQIAARMGVPLGTVATWVTRGRKLLSIGMNDRLGDLPSTTSTTSSMGNASSARDLRAETRSNGVSDEP